MPAIRQNFPKLSVSSTSECTFAVVAKVKGDVVVAFMMLLSFGFNAPDPRLGGSNATLNLKSRQNPGTSR